MSNFPVLVKQNKRRFSRDAHDIAFTQHVESCYATWQSKAQGLLKCNTVDGLCPEGRRLDMLCPDYEPEPVTALDIFLLTVEIVERQKYRAIVEKIAREEETKES